MDLFGEIGRLLATVTGRGREDGGTRNASGSVEEAQGSLRQRFMELGSAYFARLESGTPLPEGLVEKVRESVTRLEHLTALQQRRRCPACGSSQSASARYCDQCGRPMPEEVPPEELPPEGTHYCPACGALLEESGLCALCGFDPASPSPAADLPRTAPPTPAEEPAQEDIVNE